MPQIEIFIRDPDYNLVAQLDDFTRLHVIPRFNDVGSFLLEGADVGLAAQYIEPGYGIVVNRNGEFLVSGNFETLDFIGTPDADLITLAGLDDGVVVRDALAWPEKFGNFASQAYDERFGAAETIAYEYVDVNIGPGALPDRRQHPLSLATNLGRGSTVEEKARFVNLMELVNDILLKGGGLGWRVYQKPTGGIEFQIYEPSDKTGSIRFSRELGNLKGFHYTLKAPDWNFIICGGEGEGTARTIRSDGDTASIGTWNRRIEQFRDRRDTNDITILDQTIEEELAARAEKIGISLEPIDVENTAFGVDYSLGDTVTVEVRGVQIEEQIREIRLTYTPEGAETIEPIVSTPEHENLGTLVNAFLNARVRDIRARLSRLERR